MNNNKLKNLTMEQTKMINDQILKSNLSKSYTINSIDANTLIESDPNNIVQNVFNELKNLPENILENLGEITIDFKYQLVPDVQVKFKK